MSRMGEGVAKRPMVPFIVLIVITAASLGMIAMNPPSFDMDQESFRPDNEIARASVIINGSFTSTVSIMSMADARNSGGDMFTKEMFSSALAYEMSLAEMKYTDLDGVDRYYAELPMFMILSPVSAVAEATVKYLMGLPAGHPDHLGADTLPDPSDFTTHREYLVEYYQTLIVITDSPLVAPALLKTVAYMALTGADGKKMASLLTNDRVIDNATMSVSASGCMISLMFMDEGLGLIQGGGLAFEKNVISAAKDFNENNTNGPKIMAVGMETMMTDIGSMAQDDISKLLPIALAVILILLLLIYRDASDTLIAILGLLIAVIWTFGISSLAGVGMSTIAIAVPILILALGIDYSLHLVFRYREERGSGKGSKEAIAITMGSVGQALVLATVTTAVAFLSYLTSEMSALADFGLMCAIGIVCAFASMMLLIPTTQVLRDRRAEKKGKDPNEAKRYKKEADEGRDTLGKISGVGGKMAARNPWAVLGMITVIVALFGYSATNLSYDFDMYEFIPEGTDAHDTITYLSDNYSVTTSTSSVLIFADPWKIETIMAIEDSLNEMEAASILGISYQPTGPPDAEYIGTALKAFNEKYGDMDISA
ncbi:MAG: MMPL family transporter, partial [Methanomassiliicoccaceae archaeon]|nr:MMPL family transporter [Methanomassiliicoccaceae archaeon]